jgi:hypothetical protein
VAAYPVLNVTGLSNSDRSFNIQVSVCFVGVMFISMDGSAVDLVIYNWVSGELVMVFICLILWPRHISDMESNGCFQNLCNKNIHCFAFLTGDLVMLAATCIETDPSLKIYNLKLALGQGYFLHAFFLP